MVWFVHTGDRIHNRCRISSPLYNKIHCWWWFKYKESHYFRHRRSLWYYIYHLTFVSTFCLGWGYVCVFPRKLTRLISLYHYSSLETAGSDYLLCIFLVNFFSNTIWRLTLIFRRIKTYLLKVNGHSLHRIQSTWSLCTLRQMCSILIHNKYYCCYIVNDENTCMYILNWKYANCIILLN